MNNKIISAGLFAIVLLHSQLLFASKIENGGHYFYIEPVPTWITEEQYSKIPHPNETFIAYLLSQDEVRVSENREQHFKKYALTPLDSTALNESAEFSISFDPLYEDIIFHQINIIRGSSNSTRDVKKSVILKHDNSQFSKSVEDGKMLAHVVINDVKINDIVEYSYSIVGKNPIFEDKHFSKYSVGFTVPVNKLKVSIQVPKHRILHYKFRGMNSKVEANTFNAYTTYSWIDENLPVYKNEQDTPPGFDPFPTLEFTEYSNWNEVARWADKVFSIPDRSINSKIAQKIKEWEKLDSAKEKLFSALDFTQNEIRYFGKELGINSHMPYSPKLAMERGYGDCKDKSLLLNIILEKLGIESKIVLVSLANRDYINDFLPSPSAFDHAVVFANLDDTAYWLDGTKLNQHGGVDIIGHTDYGYGLLIGPDTQKLTKVTHPINYLPTHEITETYNLDKLNDPVSIQIKTIGSYSFSEWYRSEFASKSLNVLTENYLNFYKKKFPTLKLEHKIIKSDDKKKNVFSFKENYVNLLFWDKQNISEQHIDIDAYNVNRYLAKPNTLERSTPLAIAHPLKIVQKFVLNLPDEIAPIITDQDTIVEDEYISVKREGKIIGHALHISFTYQSKNDFVPPEKIAPHIETLDRARDLTSERLFIPIPSHNKVDKNIVSEIINHLGEKL